MLRVPDDDGTEDKQRDDSCDPWLGFAQPVPVRGRENEKEKKRRDENHGRVFRKHCGAESEPRAKPPARFFLLERLRERVERQDPEEDEGSIRRRDETSGHVEGSGGEDERRPKGDSPAKPFIRRQEHQERRAKIKREMKKTDAESRVTEQERAHADQPCNHRRVVVVAERGMFRVVPIVGFLRDQFGVPGAPEERTAQKHTQDDGDAAERVRIACARSARRLSWSRWLGHRRHRPIRGRI